MQVILGLSPKYLSRYDRFLSTSFRIMNFFGQSDPPRKSQNVKMHNFLNGF